MSKNSEQIKVAVYSRLAHPDAFICGQQRANMVSTAEAQPGWGIVGVFIDNGTADRPEFQKMLQQCHQGKIDLILTPSVTRFGRDMAGVLACIQELKELGMAVIFEKEGIHTLDESYGQCLSICEAIVKPKHESISQTSAQMPSLHIYSNHQKN